MTVVLLGAPIDAKAQQASLRWRDHAHLVRDALEHAEDSATGSALRKLVEAGKRLSDPLLVQVLRHAISSDPARLLLTGFPRTPAQAALLDACLI